jgi:hypothetical protein
MQVLELRGLKSLRALNAFHTLMLGLKMLPSYMGESYEEFYARIESMSSLDQEKMIREAVLFVELQREEIEAIAGFCADSNGVPYTTANLKNLGPKELMEMIVAVCIEISKIKVTLASEVEKKNSLTSPLTLAV